MASKLVDIVVKLSIVAAPVLTGVVIQQNRQIEKQLDKVVVKPVLPTKK